MLRTIFSLASLALAVLLTGCGQQASTMDELQTTVVTFPNGKTVRAERMIQNMDVMRGMMFRDSLAPDRGMLFYHSTPAKRQYWMYQVRIPLDILWLDRAHRIVEISANTPPCKTVASQCPNYGGNAESMFVLELAGGMAAKYGLTVGDTVNF